MKWWAAALTLALSIHTTATAQSQTATRIAELRAFTGAFWQTMPVRVSSACRGVVSDVLQALAEQYIVRGSGVPYYGVVQQTGIAISLTPILNAPDVMSNLDWAECRELVLRGLNDRQITPQEIPGLRQAEAEKAEQQRKRAAFDERMRQRKAERERLDAEYRECRADGGSWDRVGNRCKTRAEREERWRQHQERQQRQNEEAQAKHEAKMRRHEETLQRMREEAERQKQEREKAKAENWRKLEERRRQLSGG